MSEGLPEYFFRVRENGAQVFRVEAESRHRRIEMDPIASINLNKGEVKPQGERVLTREDKQAIRAWIRERQAIVAMREIDDVHRAMDQINLVAQWPQSRADDVQLDEVTEPLLMAMHDLRSVLVRRKAERLMKSGEEAG